jgi:hypothetical protein
MNELILDGDDNDKLDVAKTFKKIGNRANRVA